MFTWGISHFFRVIFRQVFGKKGKFSYSILFFIKSWGKISGMMLKNLGKLSFESTLKNSDKIFLNSFRSVSVQRKHRKDTLLFYFIFAVSLIHKIFLHTQLAKTFFKASASLSSLSKTSIFSTNKSALFLSSFSTACTAKHNRASLASSESKSQ